jgi:hypothetical protein
VPAHETIRRRSRALSVTALACGHVVLRAIDATTLEANAAMRSIVRRETGESYQGFLTRLAHASGIKTPTRSALARLDRKRVLIHAGGFNLGLLIRAIVGVGTARGLQGRLAIVIATVFVRMSVARRHSRRSLVLSNPRRDARGHIGGISKRGDVYLSSSCASTVSAASASGCSVASAIARAALTNFARCSIDHPFCMNGARTASASWAAERSSSTFPAKTATSISTRSRKMWRACLC